MYQAYAAVTVTRNTLDVDIISSTGLLLDQSRIQVGTPAAPSSGATSSSLLSVATLLTMGAVTALMRW